MKNAILANRYAKALFSVAQEENAFDDYAKSLKEIVTAMTTYPEVKDGLTNVMYPVDVRCKVMAHIAEAQGATQIIKNFLDLVIQKKRAAFLPEIAEAFQALIDAQRNICQGTVVTAMPLSAELNEKIQATLEKITGKKVVISTKVDPAILGGIIAKVGDLVMDGSIRSQLQGLKESIKGSE
ncbi:MAG: F0F1 ATP synthase subunit delta [Proteobacteria bacterium]|nr:F0F1 ATP synthase subunit delta [Desulfobulbaceae bacterium]MBU4152888.1 F0F1 ATP synthase subunit delta [Pseudomonadota bacterium]